MNEEDLDYSKFKELVFDLFESNFLIEEDETLRRCFLRTDIAESIIKKHYKSIGDRNSAESADSELIKAYQES